MKKAFVFPGQGSQFVGMGQDLYKNREGAKKLFKKGNEILDFSITDIMFNGKEEDLKQTKVTQPSIFLVSVIDALTRKDFLPGAVAGHSLGEFSALAAARVLEFESGLELVKTRADAMQKACDKVPGSMAAILGLSNEQIVEGCSKCKHLVVPANYNTIGQVVISGTTEGVDEAIVVFNEMGAKRAIKLNVGGAFHSPLMKPAELELAEKINLTHFNNPVCPIYQNVTAKNHTDIHEIKDNLLKQLTSPVKWTQTIMQMKEDDITDFEELEP